VWTVFALASVMALLLGSLLVAPFFRARGNAIPKTHDMDQHLAVLEDFDQGLRAGSLYPRWQAGFNWGYGLPWLNFYQPGFYYLAEPAYLALKDSTEAFLVVSVLAMAGSGVSFFWFARLFYSPIPSAVGALLYMTAPYHIVDLYIRGAFPEFTAFVFAPLVFGAAFLACRHGRARHYAGLALAVSLFMFTHLPTAYLVLMALAFYVLAWTVVERNWRIVARLAAGCALALLASAIYWLPAAGEAGFIDEYYTKTFPYSSAYLPYFPVKDDVARLLNKSFFMEAALILAAIVLLSAVSSPWRNPSGRKSQRRPHGGAPDPGQDALTRLHTRLLLAAGIFSIFLVTGLSESASQWIPKIQIVLFPWRGLLSVSFFSAVAATAVLHRLDQRGGLLDSKGWRWSYRVGITGLILCHLLAGGEIVLWALDQPNLKRVPFYADGIFYPHGATPPYLLTDSPKAMLASGQGRVNVVRWEAFSREVQVTAEQAAVVRLRTYNFPGWASSVDGRPVAIESDKDGVQTVAVPQGNHRIEVRLTRTSTQAAGAAISALGVFLIFGLLAADHWARGRRQWLNLWP